MKNIIILVLTILALVANIGYSAYSQVKTGDIIYQNGFKNGVIQVNTAVENELRQTGQVVIKNEKGEIAVILAPVQ